MKKILISNNFSVQKDKKLLKTWYLICYPLLSIEYLEDLQNNLHLFESHVFALSHQDYCQIFCKNSQPLMKYNKLYWMPFIVTTLALNMQFTKSILQNIVSVLYIYCLLIFIIILFCNFIKCSSPSTYWNFTPVYMYVWFLWNLTINCALN